MVKILSESVFYNKQYKAFRVLLTDSAFEGPQRRVDDVEQRHKYADTVPPGERSFSRCR